jgi:2-furoyl-CoA dehydrogenase large subunit
MPPMKTSSVESASPFTPLGAKGMGEGGGAGLSAVAAALQNALQDAGRPIITSSSNPYHRVWELLQKPDESRSLVSVEER